MKKADENTSIKVSSHILIRDKSSNAVLVDKSLNNSVGTRVVDNKVESKK